MAEKGVAKAVIHVLEANAGEGNDVPSFNTRVVSGITRESLKDLANLDAHEGNLLIEVMACEGGCVNGPCAITSGKAAVALLERYKAARPA
jgi:iron only hydrogenase large subunit-like protein